VSLQVVGAGLPRTGTRSLKDALELLLGSPCYHMEEVFGHLDHVPVWREAVRGHPPDWDGFLSGYVAAVDWPASAFWKELSAANPEAIVLLSIRESPEVWWQSVDATILGVARRDPAPEMAEWHRMFHELLWEAWGLRDGFDDAASAMAAYERHVDEVRSTVPRERLVEWHTGDGWESLCHALDLPIPTGPFPRVNTREEWERGSGPHRDPS
jgi:Sulfotransferase domain